MAAERIIRRSTDKEKRLLADTTLGHFDFFINKSPQFKAFEPKRKAAFAASLIDGRVEELHLKCIDGIYVRTHWAAWIVIGLEDRRIFCAKEPAFTEAAKIETDAEFLTVVRLKANGEILSVKAKGWRASTRISTDIPELSVEKTLSLSDSFIMRGTTAEIEKLLPAFDGVEDESLFDKTEIASDAMEPAPIELAAPVKKLGVEPPEDGNRWSVLMVEANSAAVADVYRKAGRLEGLRQHEVNKNIEDGGDVVVVLSIKNQSWSYVIQDGGTSETEASWLAKQLNQRALLIGYEPVSSGPYLTLYKDGNQNGFVSVEGATMSSNLPNAPKSTRNPWKFIDKVIKGMGVYIPPLELISVGKGVYQVVGEKCLAERGIDSYLVFNSKP